MIHCNPVNLLGSEIEESTKITFDVINVFLGLCVPFFFVISGFLFFINVEKLTFKVVIGKWKSRITSLVIPYILWNTLYGIVRIFKAKYLGFDGDGIVVDGSVSMLGFLRGYWDTGDGYPMGFCILVCKEFDNICCIESDNLLCCPEMDYIYYIPMFACVRYKLSWIGIFCIRSYVGNA